MQRVRGVAPLELEAGTVSAAVTSAGVDAVREGRAVRRGAQGTQDFGETVLDRLTKRCRGPEREPA